MDERTRFPQMNASTSCTYLTDGSTLETGRWLTDTFCFFIHMRYYLQKELCL